MKGKGRRKGGMFLPLLIAMPVLTILAAMGSAKLILSGTIGEEQMQLCVCVYTAIIAFLLCMICALRSPQKKAIWGMGTAAFYFCMLLLGNVLFFGIGFGSVIPGAACVMGGGLLGTLLGAAKRRKIA